MLNIDFNTIILNIKDPNITFTKNGPSEELFKGARTIIFDADLAYKPDMCDCCGCIYENNNIISKGFAHKPSLIRMPRISGLNSYIRLRKQRHCCKYCGTSFTCKTNIVESNCFISTNLKQQVADHASYKMAETDIASLCNVSHSTVGRIIDDYHSIKKLYKHSLPEVIGMDEFKSTKNISGAMSFVFSDLKMHKIIDIVEDRRLFSLEKYFDYYSDEAKAMVKYVVIDMYSPYIQLIKKKFPNADIIIDRFHLVQLLGRSLQQTRIKVMKNYKTSSLEYKLLKKHFKLLGKHRTELNDTHFRKWARNGSFKTSLGIVDIMLNIDDELKEAYEIYQSFMLALKINDYNQIKDILKNKDDIKSEYMKKSVNTLITFLPYIENTINTNYTNGYVEGFNNLIKVIKRVSFDYKSFYRFKNRIMIISKATSTKKRYSTLR